MENVSDFLDWLVSLDIRHYKTEKFPDYTPTGESHFYLCGSQERFTSEEMVMIWTNKTDNVLNERWQNAVFEGLEYNKYKR